MLRMIDAGPVSLCAETTAAWHAAWLSALGIRSEASDGVWRALDPPPFIYWAAITLSPGVPAESLAGANGTVCDAWAELDLAPFGLVARDRDGLEDRSIEPWFVRSPSQLAAEDPPPELEVVDVGSVAEVAEFEAVSVRGFGGEGEWVAPGTLHPPSILGDPRMTMLIGRVRHQPVSAAMSYTTDWAVGIYGVTTIADARGHGYASALTRALVDPHLPALLSPSPEAERLYRRIGFREVGTLRQWHRPEVGEPAPGGDETGTHR
jgi:hypothetical protein